MTFVIMHLHQVINALAFIIVLIISLTGEEKDGGGREREKRGSEEIGNIKGKAK